MARGHAAAYLAEPRVKLVACADISDEATTRFSREFGIPATYGNCLEMMRQERPDVVSICTHHPLHSPMTIGVARETHPKAILCEKPIAMDLDSADAMLAACKETGTLLVVGHQRRYSRQYAMAKSALDTGRIGDVVFVEAFGHPRSSLLVDSTHTIDLVRFYLDNVQAEWVIGQVDAREHRSAWGQQIEDTALGWIGFANGVRVLLGAGSTAGDTQGERLSISPRPITGGTYHRIVLYGTKGRLEINGDAPAGDEPLVRILIGEHEQVVLGADDFRHRPGVPAVHQEVSAMIDCLEQPGLRHPLEGQSARDTLEILMAIYESSRQRRALRLPLTVGDNPLISMLDAGVI